MLKPLILAIVLASLFVIAAGCDRRIENKHARSALLLMTKKNNDVLLRRQHEIVKSAKITTNGRITNIGSFKCDLENLEWSIVFVNANGMPSYQIAGRFFRNFNGQWEARPIDHLDISNAQPMNID